jgi:hypothetical protein
MQLFPRSAEAARGEIRRRIARYARRMTKNGVARRVPVF